MHDYITLMCVLCFIMDLNHMAMIVLLGYHSNCNSDLQKSVKSNKLCHPSFHRHAWSCFLYLLIPYILCGLSKNTIVKHEFTNHIRQNWQFAECVGQFEIQYCVCFGQPTSNLQYYRYVYITTGFGFMMPQYILLSHMIHNHKSLPGSK